MSPRSAQANEHLREQSRERILGAALEVFAEKGFHNATISDITGRAGVSRGLVTYYFPGKHELVVELLGRYLEGLTGLLGVTGTPDERLAAMIDGILAGAAATLPVQRLALSLMTHPSTHPLFARVEVVKDTQIALLEDTLRDLFAERGAADPALEEVMFRSVMEGVIFKAAIYADSYPLERVRARVYAMYDLPAPREPLLDPDPPPVGRLRAESPDELGGRP
ncbi:TetR/AcrR family transcriptional regulator [Actinophytocola gossypii]|uniref:TetR/AcrR family transcriptional regulator n=1 Tax=Actinophytocola gossypii TaxID=2812003 RepID=A0ABT2JF23_9PSEU|nr:TetR/AcrR family transcriptional regulator [Actinophytocola gossypii]MCT2585879.1 TetR/AcrR family transcriptional regulator [Actinophytocola gossypii]